MPVAPDPRPHELAVAEHLGLDQALLVAGSFEVGTPYAGDRLPVHWLEFRGGETQVVCTRVVSYAAFRHAIENRCEHPDVVEVKALCERVAERWCQLCGRRLPPEDDDTPEGPVESR